MRKVPTGIRILSKCQVRDRMFSYKVFIIIFTFVCYTSYHLCRKPISVVKILAGLFQSTGWTSVVTCMGNWLGKGKRGFIMGVWNANVSVGKILGLFVAGAFVDYEWGLSFIVPGVVIFFNGVLTFLFLVPEPTDVGCETPDQIGRKCNSQSEPTDCAENEAETITVFGEISLNSMGDVTITSFASTDGLTDGLTNGHGNSSILPQQLSTSEVEIPVTYSASKSAFISVIFDVGGIFGGITSGMLSDVTGKSALTCFGSLLLAGPILHIYYVYGNLNLGANIGLSFLCGFFVYGPNTLITTAVSADLGTQQALKDNTKALATVSALIDGTGSIGAAIGPLLVGVIVSSYGWSNVFYVLIASVICAMLFLLRLLIKEIKDSELLNTIKTRFTSKNHVI